MNNGHWKMNDEKFRGSTGGAGSLQVYRGEAAKSFSDFPRPATQYSSGISLGIFNAKAQGRKDGGIQSPFTTR